MYGPMTPQYPISANDYQMETLSTTLGLSATRDVQNIPCKIFPGVMNNVAVRMQAGYIDHVQKF